MSLPTSAHLERRPLAPPADGSPGQPTREHGDEAAQPFGEPPSAKVASQLAQALEATVVALL
jgi:hypothetical protein